MMESRRGEPHELSQVAPPPAQRPAPVSPFFRASFRLHIHGGSGECHVTGLAPFVFTVTARTCPHLASQQHRRSCCCGCCSLARARAAVWTGGDGISFSYGEMADAFIDEMGCVLQALDPGTTSRL